MTPALGTERARQIERPSEVNDLDPGVPLRALELAVERTAWPRQFASSLEVLIRGPVAPKDFLGDPYFRDCWIESRFPKLAFLGAVAVQVLLVLFPPPIWNVPRPHLVVPQPEMELTWYGPAKDFPNTLPAPKLPKSTPRAGDSNAPPLRGADAFHPRQTIVSEPLHPNHPRQTLIQPAAPPEAPKILPQLPNIVQLAGSEPARPRLQLTPKQLAALRPKVPAASKPSDLAAPNLSTPEKELGAIDVASSLRAPEKPALPVSPMSAPRAAAQRTSANVSAPDIAGHLGDSNTLIALSATPAPVAPPPSIPAGNLSARISISPEGPQPGIPGGTPKGSVAGGGPAGGGGHGPEGIFITGGNRANTAPVSGLGIGQALRAAGKALPLPPGPLTSPALEGEGGSGSAKDVSKLDGPPEKLLGAKQVYTLHVDMPNMTSASGSWILNFAELDESDPAAYQKLATTDLRGPVPLRKVDPKYPPELRTMHVDGEVVLYAIIRKDGTVDSIQLVHSVDPLLDANAMRALAQWKFTPGEKRGEPIDLEAVVHIPFRSRAPQF